MDPHKKLIKERDKLRLQIKGLKAEYEIMEPGSAGELTVGTDLALLRLKLCKVQNELQGSKR